jgi:cell division protein FtsW (lipid II flippase)
MSAKRAPVSERPLIGRALLALLAAFAMVLLVRHTLGGEVEPRYLYPLLGYVALVLVLRVALRLVAFRGDQVLLASAVFLAGLGVVIQVRLGTLDVTASARWANYAVPAGFALMLALAVLGRGGRVRWLAGAYVPAALLAVAVLGGLLLAGRRFRGGVFLEGNINPTELVKVLLVIYLAGLFTVYRKCFERPVLPGVPSLNPGLLFSMVLCWALPMGLLVVLRDLGLMVLLNAVLLVMAVLSSGRWSYLVTGLLLVGGAGALLISVMPHGGNRVEVWLDPFADPTGRGWQVLQGLSAMATGGWWGAGLGAGHPTAIPIAASDFVYAALAEEIGYVGCGLVLGIYLLFFYRGFRLADSLREPFAQSLATGLTAALALQTLLNVGGVTKALPLTGITLPFLSLGGSSLITSFLMLGLLLALSDPGGKTGR